MPQAIPLSQAIVLGVVQGITEFLPVSSTAHLRLIPRLMPASMGWHDAGLAFDAALHTGTLIALIIYFWRDWIDVLWPITAGLRGKQAPPHFGQNLFWGIIVGCIPAGVAGYLISDKLDAIEQNPELNMPVMAVVASALIVVGVILYIADRCGAGCKRKLAEMNIVDFIIIGLAQASALIWGVSRSGATISAGRFRGLERDAAARFSFLLSTPIFLGVALLHIKKLMEQGIPKADILPFITGLTVSTLVGIAVIRFLLHYLRKHSLNLFVWYRIILGVIVLTLIATGKV